MSKPINATAWATFFRLAARGLLYAPSQRQDNTNRDLSYTSYGALAATRNSSTTVCYKIIYLRQFLV